MVCQGLELIFSGLKKDGVFEKYFGNPTREPGLQIIKFCPVVINWEWCYTLSWHNYVDQATNPFPQVVDENLWSTKIQDLFS